MSTIRSLLLDLGFSRFTRVVCGVWTLVVAASLVWTFVQQVPRYRELSRAEARGAATVDAAYREWNAACGGVYVRADGDTPTGSFGEHPEDEVTSPSGERLVRVDPERMSWQMFRSLSDQRALSGRIIVLDPGSPGDRPDANELAALDELGRGAEEVVYEERIGGRRVLSLLRPLRAEGSRYASQSWLRRGGGVIRGAVSITVPVVGVFDTTSGQWAATAGAHGVVWLIGFLVVGAGSRRLQNQVEQRLGVERALRESERRLSLALGGADIGLWDWEPERDRLTFSNDLCSLFGYTADELEAQAIGLDALVHPEDRSRVRAAMADHLDGRSRSFECEHRLRGSDGMWRWVLDRGRISERAADGRPIRVTGTHLDISDRVAAEEAMRAAKDEAEKASRAKGNFLAHMSHEFRTPLSGIIGMTSLLLDTRLDQQQRHYVETVRSSGDILLELINDVLDYSKIEAGRLRFDEIDFDPRELMAEVVGLLSPTARRKGLRCEATVADQVPAVLRGDPGRIRQVLMNLVGNAVKFTDRGGVETAMGVVDDRGDGVMLRCEVRDTGIGIATEQQQVIFDSFAQAETAIGARRGGTGLGLAISKQLVEMMGGAIGVTSEAGAGSTFWFTADLRVAARSPGVLAGGARPVRSDPAAAAGGHAPATAAAGRVLVADDDRINQQVIAGLIEKMGYRVDVVGNGRKALDALDRESYDLVLMDCQMPELDGYETTRAIRRRHGADRQVPIVALTAHATAEHRARAEAAGMDDYLVKPLRYRTLEAAIRRWLPGAAGAAAHSAPVLDLAMLEDGSGGDPDHVREVVVRFIDRASARVDAVAAAVAAGDTAALLDEARALERSSTGFGAAALAAEARRLQDLALQDHQESVSEALARIRVTFDELCEELRRRFVTRP